MIGGGVEYWYDNQFAVRGGYFHESQNKGNRKYFTAGIGIRYQTFGLDFDIEIEAKAKDLAVLKYREQYQLLLS